MEFLIATFIVIGAKKTPDLWFTTLLGHRLIGPFFIDGSLNQFNYHQLLSEDVERVLDEIPLAELYEVYFQQDSATPYNAQITVGWFNRHFNEEWIGTYGPIRWPARSPDLTPLDFWFWEYLQDRVYLRMPRNANDLRNRIIEACQEIPNNFILNATHGCIQYECQSCIDHNSNQFEQYL